MKNWDVFFSTTGNSTAADRNQWSSNGSCQFCNAQGPTYTNYLIQTSASTPKERSKIAYAATQMILNPDACL